MSDDVVRVTCAHENCGTFAMDRTLREKLKRTGETFTCPGGHPQHFNESPEQKLRERVEQLEREVERLESRNESLEEQADHWLSETRTERDRRKAAEATLLERIDGVVEVGDGWMWGCACGSRSRKHFDEERDAESALEKHRREYCENATANGAVTG